MPQTSISSSPSKIWRKLQNLSHEPRRTRGELKVGILGCMAERLKNKFFEQSPPLVDLVAGPDAYKDLPRLLNISENHESAINVLLSRDETYADILPVQLNPGSYLPLSPFKGAVTTCAPTA
ncbi:CDK5 regulatory subunitassociated protein 1like, partial [Caligus rogercresseyi]